MISWDFFSVANNLGDSVAFNLESDSRLQIHMVESRTPQGNQPDAGTCQVLEHFPVHNVIDEYADRQGPCAAGAVSASNRKS